MSIIAMSGKMQSGKNTVASIIQYLYDKNNLEDKNKDAEEDFNSYIKNKHYLKSNWKQVAFADKLKDIICLLINCNREQLEDESFKNTELGEEWYLYIVKNTYSNEILSPCFLTKEEARHWEQTQDWYEDTGGYDTCVELIKLTPRFLMQYIGTDLLRNQLHPEIWVNSLMSEYKPLSNLCEHYTQAWVNGIGNCLCNISHKQSEGFKTMCEVESKYPNWIITDCRFPNELEAVKKRGGITIRVNRPCNICGGSGYHKMSCPVSKSGEHYSEIALDSAAFDFVINNNKDIEHLVKEVKKILKKLNII